CLHSLPTRRSSDLHEWTRRTTDEAWELLRHGARGRGLTRVRHFNIVETAVGATIVARTKHRLTRFSPVRVATHGCTHQKLKSVVLSVFVVLLDIVSLCGVERAEVGLARHACGCGDDDTLRGGHLSRTS